MQLTKNVAHSYCSYVTLNRISSTLHNCSNNSDHIPAHAPLPPSSISFSSRTVHSLVDAIAHSSSILPSTFPSSTFPTFLFLRVSPLHSLLPITSSYNQLFPRSSFMPPILPSSQTSFLWYDPSATIFGLQRSC